MSAREKKEKKHKEKIPRIALANASARKREGREGGIQVSDGDEKDWCKKKARDHRKYYRYYEACMILRGCMR